MFTADPVVFARERRGHLYFTIDGIEFNRTEWTIYQAARKAGKEGVLCSVLRDMLYDHRADGGPLYAWQCVWIAKFRLNKKLKARGETIVNTGGGKWARYRLEDKP